MPTKEDSLSNIIIDAVQPNIQIYQRGDITMSNEKSLRLYLSTDGWSAYFNNGEYVNGNLETAERVYELYRGRRGGPWHHVPGGCKNCINLYLGSLYIRLNADADVFAYLKKAGFSDGEVNAMYRLYTKTFLLQDPPKIEVSFGCGSYIVLRIDGKIVYGDDKTKVNRVSVAVGSPREATTSNNARMFLASMWVAQELRNDDMPSTEDVVNTLVNNGFERDDAVKVAVKAAYSVLAASILGGVSASLVS